MVENNEKAIYNSRLLYVVNCDEPPNAKINKIKTYLKHGADINTVDDMNNTSLHIAVMKAEASVVKFLLHNAADPCIKNKNNQTALDIAQLHKPDEVRKRICDVLTKVRNTEKVVSNSYKKVKANDVKGKTIKKNKLHYIKRAGTSGVSGHLYETKLLTLILSRILYDNDVSEFCLGTNVEGMGAFDDIVLRYKKNQNTKLLFLQAKHKDDPSKYTVTLEELLKDDGDFNLLKYFKSYLDIRRNFKYNSSKNIIFEGSFSKLDCDFVIYTPAIGNSNDNFIEIPETESLIRTSDNGKVFQINLDYEDLKHFLPHIVETRTGLLAKRLSEFILKNKCDNMMADEMIATYHVFLAQNVILLGNKKERQDATGSYIEGKLRESFLNSKDKLLLLIKQTISKELKELKQYSLLNEIDLENKLKKLSFKLPVNFGNLTFKLQSNEEENTSLDNLCMIFQELFKRAEKTDSLHFVKIKDNTLKDSDFKARSLGGLVGNLIIYDDETKALKFNLEDNNLPEDCIKVLKRLKHEYHNLEKYRINDLTGYLPEMSLVHEESDVYQIKEFLTKLKLYTNQATEDQVENYVKDEIKVNCDLEQHYSILRVSCDAIFLKVHDEIQKWWKKLESCQYLTKESQYFDYAKQEILGNPLLNILDYRSKTVITNDTIRFNIKAIEALNIDDFLNNDKKILIVFSNEVHMTSIKIFQYLEQVKYTSSVFIDMDYVIDKKNIVYKLKNELKASNANMLVLVHSNKNTGGFEKDFEYISNEFKGHIILITNSNSINRSLNSKIINTTYDEMNSFTDLTNKVQNIVLKERELIFQAQRLSFSKVVNTEFLKSLKPFLIRKIANSQSTIVGQTIANKLYNKTVDFYIKRRISRQVTLSVNKESCADLDIVNYSNVDDKNFQDSTDIVLIAGSDNDFDQFCNMMKDKNVHWVRRIRKEHYVWEKTRGSIETLSKYVINDSNANNCVQLETLKDVKDKVVIISAEPGMGKSTLLSHVALQTKCLHKNVWVLMINFHDHVDQLTKWKDKKDTGISLIEAFKLLYSAAGIAAFGKDKGEEKFVNLDKIAKQIVINDANEVHVNDVNDDILEVHLFNYCYNSGNVALLFDGFDEICPDFAQEAIELLQILKSSKVSHLWVTTRRYNVLTQLQCALGTFSYTLEPLTESEQKQSLRDIWSSMLRLSFIDNNDVELFFNQINKALGDKHYRFTSNPLQMVMIAQVYKNYVIMTPTGAKIDTTGLSDTLNLCSLYEEFVKEKFYKIRFGEKLNYMTFREPEMSAFPSEKYSFVIKGHKKISAFKLLYKIGEFNLFSEDDIKDVKDFIDVINSGKEKTGIIERVVGNEPIFVHLTFAEYFATEFLFDRLQSSSCDASVWKFVINTILVSDNGGVRRFINSKLQQKQQFCKTFEHCNPNIILETILSQTCMSTNAFYVSVQEDLQMIVLFLLKYCKAALDKNSLDNFIKLFTIEHGRNCTICAIVIFKQDIILKYLMEVINYVDDKKITDLFICGNIPLIPIKLCDSNLNDKSVFYIATKNMNDKSLIRQLIFTFPKGGIRPSHFIGINSTVIPVIEYYFNKLKKEQLIKIFNVVDYKGQLPAHYAANVQNFEFFILIDKLLGRKELEIMMRTKDYYNTTPMTYFCDDENKFWDELRQHKQNLTKNILWKVGCHDSLR